MSQIKRIAIIGATGMLGQPVTRELVRAGFKVTALVRDLAKAQSILPPEVSLQVADLTDPASLVAPLQQVDYVYLNLSTGLMEGRDDFHPETDGLSNVLEVARQANIQRISYISSILKNYQGLNGFKWWVFDLKNQALELIKRSAIPYTIFYPSNFMETIPFRFRQGNTITIAGEPNHPNYWIAGSDYGKQVAQSFSVERGENKEYIVQGVEALRPDEAARTFVEQYHKEVLELAQMPAVQLEALKDTSPVMNYLWHITEAMNNYPEKFQAQETWDELGKPSITIKEFAQYFA